jgi:hypothetical protein
VESREVNRACRLAVWGELLARRLGLGHPVIDYIGRGIQNDSGFVDRARARGVYLHVG